MRLVHCSVAMVVLLGACSGPSEPDEDCELLVMAPCPECGPGEVTGGVGFSTRASHARQANGDTVVLACGRATYFDASYNVLREQEIDVERYSQIAADLTTDEMYILEVEASYDGEFPPGIAIRSVAADGSTRWRSELPSSDFTQLMAVPGGVALADFFGTVGAVFDREGNELPVPAVIGVPEGDRGMIGVTTGNAPDGSSTATLTAVDANGQLRWTRTWRSPSTGFPGGVDVKLSPMDSGDVVVTGSFAASTFELGETTLTGTGDTETAFVARLDPTGTTRWAFTLPYQSWNMSATGDGEGALVVGSIYNSDEYMAELSLSTVTPAGLGTQQSLGSTSELGAAIDGLQEHGAGQVTAVIAIYPENDYETDLTLGWHRLLSGLTGRRYLVELAR